MTAMPCQREKGADAGNLGGQRAGWSRPVRSRCGPRTCGRAYEHSEVLPRATARLHSRKMTRAASSCTRLPVFALLKFPLSWECAQGPRGRTNGRAHSDLHLCACAWPLDDVVTHGFSATSACASTHASARVVCERHVRRWTSGSGQVRSGILLGQNLGP